MLDPNINRRIRNLIPDLDPVFGDNSDEFMFDDQSIEDFYTDGNSSIKWAAGLAKITLSTSEAYISKKITNYETSTDGPAVAKEIRAAGYILIEEAKTEIRALDLDYFDIVYFGEEVETPEGAVEPYWGLGWV